MALSKALDLSAPVAGRSGCSCTSQLSGENGQLFECVQGIPEKESIALGETQQNTLH